MGEMGDTPINETFLPVHSKIIELQHANSLVIESCGSNAFIHINDDKFITLTSAPTTPRLVRRRYSKDLVLLTVCRNG